MDRELCYPQLAVMNACLPNTPALSWYFRKYVRFKYRFCAYILLGAPEMLLDNTARLQINSAPGAVPPISQPDTSYRVRFTTHSSDEVSLRKK